MQKALFAISKFPLYFCQLTGDRNKGWYYGENVRTGKRGWFPLAYTEQVKDADVDSGYDLFMSFRNYPLYKAIEFVFPFTITQLI